MISPGSSQSPLSTILRVGRWCRSTASISTTSPPATSTTVAAEVMRPTSRSTRFIGNWYIRPTRSSPRSVTCRLTTATGLIPKRCSLSGGVVARSYVFLGVSWVILLDWGHRNLLPILQNECLIACIPMRLRCTLWLFWFLHNCGRSDWALLHLVTTVCQLLGLICHAFHLDG